MKSNYFVRLGILTGLYLLTGKLGLMLALPPGYATVIWPPSGIALGMLLVCGARLWPGVLVASLLLNAYNSGVFADADWWSVKLLAAFGIAVGSTLQALAGRALLVRFRGIPLRLDTPRDILSLLFLARPLTCVVAATIGTATLAALGIVASGDIVRNWLAWWSGDAFGVVVFMPLVLLAPGG